MITLDFLQKTQDVCMEIRQPRAFEQAGYYSAQYCVSRIRRDSVPYYWKASATLTFS
jgi:hypothetical protein